MSELLTEIKLGVELVMGHPVKMRAVGLFADPARRCGVVGGEGAFRAPCLLLLKKKLPQCDREDISLQIHQAIKQF